MLRPAAAVVATVALLAAGSGIAAAQGGGVSCDSDSGVCTVVAGGGGGAAPATPTGGGQSAPSGGGPTGPAPKYLPTSDPAMTAVVDPVTGALMSILAQAEDGTQWECVAGQCTPLGGVPAAPQPVVNVANLVQQAISGMQLQPIDIGITPSDEPGKVGLVGLPAWFWSKTSGPGITEPVTRVVSAGGVTVTATATLTSVTVNPGDGSLPVVCPGHLAPFTPYTDGAGSLPSPTCGLPSWSKSSITEPDKRFHVSASSAWVVNWAAVGAVNAGGVIPMVLTDTTTVQVGEMQVLVTPGT